MRDWRELLSIFALKLFHGLLVAYCSVPVSEKLRIEKCLKCRLSLGVFSLAKQRQVKVKVFFSYMFNIRELPVIDL